MPSKKKKKLVPHKALKRLRYEILEMTQAEFAKLVGISEAFVQSVELGRCKPSPEYCMQVLYATGVAPSSIERPNGRLKIFSTLQVYDKDCYNTWKHLMEGLAADMEWFICALSHNWRILQLAAFRSGAERSKLASMRREAIIWLHQTAKHYDLLKNIEPLQDELGLRRGGAFFQFLGDDPVLSKPDAEWLRRFEHIDRGSKPEEETVFQDAASHIRYLQSSKLQYESTYLKAKYGERIIETLLVAQYDEAWPEGAEWCDSYFGFGRKLQKLRLELALSQGRLSHLSSITPKTIHDLEGGYYAPTEYMITKLAAALHLQGSVEAEFIKIGTDRGKCEDLFQDIKTYPLEICRFLEDSLQMVGIKSREIDLCDSASVGSPHNAAKTIPHERTMRIKMTNGKHIIATLRLDFE
jgi:DNA-binding XRE family transcriptional regulator